MTKLTIEYEEVDVLIPYVNNSRTHSDEQVAQIAASIKEFGWTNPILIDGERTVVAGHGRLLAARKLGMKEVPVIILDYLTKAQQRALVIADNKLALNAGWDMTMLISEIDSLKLENFDLSLLGFDNDELSKLFDDEKIAELIGEEQDVEAVFEVAVSCSNEEDQERVFEMMTAEGFKCRILTM